MDSDEESRKQNVRDLVIRFWTTLQNGDFENFAEMLADDVSWEIRHLGNLLPTGNVVRGKNAIMTVLMPFHTKAYKMETVRFDIKNVFVDGDTAIMEFNVTAITGLGRPYNDVQYIGVYTTSGGKILSIREYPDGLVAAEAHFDAA